MSKPRRKLPSDVIDALSQYSNSELRRLVAMVSPDFAGVLALKMYRGGSHPLKIAEFLRKPVKTVLKFLHAALESQCLGNDGAESDKQLKSDIYRTLCKYRDIARRCSTLSDEEIFERIELSEQEDRFKADEALRPQQEKAVCVTYFAASREFPNLVNIGKSTNVEARMRAYNGAKSVRPIKYELIAVTDTPETEVHQRFKQFRAGDGYSREIFRFMPTIRSYIRKHCTVVTADWVSRSNKVLA